MEENSDIMDFIIRGIFERPTAFFEGFFRNSNRPSADGFFEYFRAFLRAVFEFEFETAIRPPRAVASLGRASF